MKTDIPLKRLTLLRAADLLPLLGTPDSQVLAVESLELPASATRPDNVLRLWSPCGQEYLHVVEWQGYNDPAVLWRFAGYLAWLGQRHPGTPITGSLIYLTPADDKEKLMESDLLSYLMEEKLIERQTTFRNSLQQTLEEMVIARFPQAPITLVRDIRQVADPDTLQRLMVMLVRAADLAEFEQALAQAAAAVTE